MIPYLKEHFENPFSLYEHGFVAKRAVENARGTLRLPTGGLTTEEEIDRVVLMM
ncbi:MAG: hypothetical protein JXB42_08815 [Deltaproteobacteria bacterium]|nr:hypothetical protein [Deltaproteobacteria bacterium]